MFAHATNNPGFHFVEDLGLVLSRIGAVFAGAQQAKRVYEELSRLSAGELAARGMSREDIARLTLQAMDRATQD